MNIAYRPTRLLEPEIKAMIFNHLLINGHLSSDASIINEFTVCNYSRRVDLAVIEKNRLTAFEIKSEADSLSRLEGQTEKYLEIFDKVVVVADSKHIESILKTVPKHVAVWEISKATLKIKQRGKFIPTQDKTSLLNLMKASELRKLCKKFDLPSTSKNRNTLIKTLQASSLRKIRNAAILCVKERFQATSNMFLKATENTEALPKDIELLSPYIKSRRYENTLIENKKLRWETLKTHLNEDPHLLELCLSGNKLIFGDIPSDIQSLLDT